VRIIVLGGHSNYFRTYDPSTGRYLEADPLGVNAGVNLYLYANGRPTVAIDPTGLAELGVREFDTGPNRRFGLQPPLTWPPYAQHCFLRFNYDNSDTLSFDPSGVHADPFPQAATFTPITGPRDNDQCLRDQMQRCKPFDYDFFLFNCCNCASNAIYYCGLGLQGDWPNWPLDASEPPYWSTGPTPVELWLEMFMK
jgi:hypothetical protein